MKTHDQHCLTQFTSVSIIAVWLHISAMITYVNISVFFLYHIWPDIGVFHLWILCNGNADQDGGSGSLWL